MCLSATDWRDLERSIVVPRQQGQEILIYILITEHAQSRSYFHVGASKVFSTDVQRKDMDLGFALNRSSLLNQAVPNSYNRTSLRVCRGEIQHDTNPSDVDLLLERTKKNIRLDDCLGYYYYSDGWKGLDRFFHWRLVSFLLVTMILTRIQQFIASL